MPAVRTAIFGCSSRGSVGAYYSAARFVLSSSERENKSVTLLRAQRGTVARPTGGAKLFIANAKVTSV